MLSNISVNDDAVGDFIDLVLPLPEIKKMLLTLLTKAKDLWFT